MKKLNSTQLLFLLITNLAIAVVTVILLTATDARASHISAGNITYQPQGGGQYLVRLALYRDCSGVTMFPNEYVYAHSNSGCAADITINVNLIPNTGQQLPVSSCVLGGNCYEEYIYEGTALIPACSDWELFYATCCRNIPDNIDNFNVPVNDFYIYTSMNNAGFTNNSSPEFNYAAIGTFCVNNNFFFDQGATDPDGDQLTYSLISAMGFDGWIKSNLLYNPPYTPTAPLPCSVPLTINAQTGLIAMTPSMAGKFVIVIAVEEKDAITGVYKGTTIRDMQISVSANCNNIVPDFDAAILSNGISAGCGDSVITIALSSNVQCGTVASDGSDFLVTLNSNGTTVPITSAQGANCNIGLSNSVRLNFANQLGAGTYTISVKPGIDNNTLLSECGLPMLTTNQVQLTVSGNFNISLTHTDLSCASGSTGSITATSTGLPGPFLYSIDGVNYSASNIFTGLAAGTYTVYAQTGGNCISSASVTVSNATAVTMNVNKTDISCYQLQDGTATINVTAGSPPYNVSWNTTPIQNNMAVTNLAAGTYIATVTDANSCTSTTTVNILDADSIVLAATGTDTICVGQQATLSALASGGAGPFTYNWNPAMQGASISVSPSQSTTFQVTATDAHGCVSTQQSIQVNVRPALTISANADTGMCAGNTIILSVAAAGGNGGPYHFDWNNGKDTLNSFTVSPANTTTYTVTVSDGCTSPASSKSIKVEIYASPVPDFTADTTVDCFPLFGNFNNLSTISSGSISTWNWNFGDSSVSTNQNPVHIYNQAGSFSVSLHTISDNGCEADTIFHDFITVKPGAKPVVDFSYNPSKINILEPSVNFTNNSTGGNNYQWNFGDGGISHQFSPVYTFGDTGHFEVQLMVTNNLGCTSTGIKMVEVMPVVSFFMPNAFSPNGDGINDIFKAEGEYIAEADLIIFNRWGQLVFQSNTISKGWDGTYKSQAAPEGVYTYHIKTKGSDLKTNVTEGSLVLIR